MCLVTVALKRVVTGFYSTVEAFSKVNQVKCNKMSSKYAYQLVPEEYYLGTNQDDVDLGEQIRKQLKNFTNPANISTETDTAFTKQIESLERLTNNVYGKKFPRVYKSTATGLTPQQCSQVLSSEFLQMLNDNNDKRRKK